ncbi:hypothetical protein, partial [Vibrio sp. 10N.261.46.A3]|uniref:hypothetical protein n=1 Tax=Vibrio sp. 10N.261.46.A3 TaxID=3229658 RepID=UPI00354DFBAB
HNAHLWVLTNRQVLACVTDALRLSDLIRLYMQAYSSPIKPNGNITMKFLDEYGVEICMVLTALGVVFGLYVGFTTW